jgi:predicted DCC family thiol-disulfide oxidoreductase YuxK
MKKTPMIFPPALFNGLIYTTSWLLLVKYGNLLSFFSVSLIFITTFATELILFYFYDKKSLTISPILAIYALGIGFLQESLFIRTENLQYSNDSFYPPLWLISLYPLFSLTLNSSFSFLNKNFLYPFLVGGFGGIFSYITGEHLQQKPLIISESLSLIFLSWAISLTTLIWVNKKLIALYNFYTNPTHLEADFTAFFDIQCPVCSREMQILKDRPQKGKITYACPISQKELEIYTDKFSYDDSMKSIHSIDKEGNVIKGIKTLAELYARVGLVMISILLTAPIIQYIFQALYFIFSKFRILLKKRYF